MGRAIAIETALSSADLRRLARGSHDANRARRLLALAAVLDGMSRTEAARIGGMDRQTLCVWVHRFNAQGVDGLSDRWGPGPEPRLTVDRKTELAALVEDGPDVETDGVTRWRRIDPEAVIRDRFGAIRPARGVGAAVMMPFADTDAMRRHLREISRAVAPGAHAVLPVDRAGWHTTGKLKLPRDISLILPPPRSPELNPVENIWQYLRQTYLSNRVFETEAAILDAGCQAWNKLVERPWKIMSIGLRRWAREG